MDQVARHGTEVRGESTLEFKVTQVFPQIIGVLGDLDSFSAVFSGSIFSTKPSPFQVVCRLIFEVGPVLPQEGIGVFAADPVRRRDIVLLGFQAVEYLFGRRLICRPTLRVKVGHDLDQPINPDLGIIGKFQYSLTNCRLFGLASGDSTDHFNRDHIPSPVLFLFRPRPVGRVCSFPEKRTNESR